ncbi:hypothetical protein JOC25_000017 [Solibacillus kalamii]|uniref:Uncharacterized protein n=1 Tax=Solibacillus kalamii TaxID=1748298 RepID=A0ABX3ZHH3_9BACL|nr:hypothetical protein [Solibacillus kalamii]MBM7663561.1 hypothetical protein [Solibacillus kalamii]OUZ39176.1 hypothetical protein CBM15_09965 [Solibacillus kalamii]
MAVEMWRIDDENWAFYCDMEHEAIHRSIKRSKDWDEMATYRKNDKLLAIQYRLPNSDYRKGRRLLKRVHDSEELSV